VDAGFNRTTGGVHDGVAERQEIKAFKSLSMARLGQPRRFGQFGFCFRNFQG
jgi:hypothetical protein